MRTKLGAVLAIPAVAFIVVVALQAGLLVRQAATLDSFAAQVAVADTVTNLVHELQFERDWVVGQLAAAVASPAVARDRDQLIESVIPAREAVASARAELETAMAPLRDDPGVAGAVSLAGGALDGLTQIHAGIEQGWLREEAIFDGYSRAIEATLALLPTPLAVEGTELGGYRELAEVKELTARIRGQMHALISAGGYRPGEAERLADLRAQRRAALDRYRLAATPSQLGRFDEAVRGQAVRATARLEQAALEQAGSGSVDEVTPQQWWQAATTELELYREVEIELLSEVDSQVERASQDRRRQTLVVVVAASLTLLAALGLSVGIGRSMVRSLRLLRGQAVEVAQRGLPGLLARLRTVRVDDPITEPPVVATTPGADEVGEVGEAFTQVHRSAVRLAVEQALMRRNVNRIFVNVARRSQLLVERQLEVLDELEREEVDPAQLANLFRLDHLATRMRRNNDSLLVLTAAEPARRYDQPTPLASVAKAAIAEIERYQRVRDDVAVDLHVVGYAVVDLAHLLAELLDNATAFSEPDSVVRLTGQRVSVPLGALVEITDAGIGMSAAALRDANELLTNPPVIDVATSQRMGLVVVGQIAARHGMRVRLAAASPGLSASVWLPDELLTSAPEPVEQPPELAAKVRRTPARAEDVLGAAQSAGETDSLWWSRPAAGDDGGGNGRARPPVAAPPAAPVVAHRISAAGLPIRVPMAQVPLAGAEPVTAPPVAVELDPDEVGGTLSAFYGGVHKAEIEDLDAIPGGP